MFSIYDAQFWTAVAFFAFLALVLYMGVPKLIGASLDKRAAGISSDLDEARKLKEDARALLAEYEKKRKGAESEAQAIVEQAKAEAAALAAESQQALKELLERRTKLAEDKIARAQQQALADVRLAAIDAAVEASERIIGGRLNDNAASDMVNRSIAELRGKL